MRYSDWVKDYEKLALEVTDIPLVNVKEVLSVGGKHFVLAMGKEAGIRDDTDGQNQEIQPSYLRPYYTHHKEEFQDALETLGEKVKEQRNFAINVVNALTESAVPEVVMARMQGEQVSGDAFDMLRQGAGIKLKELHKFVMGNLPVPFSAFNLNIANVAGNDLRVVLSGADYDLSYGPLGVNRSGPRNTDLEACMFFLSNFKFILKKLEQLAVQLKVVRGWSLSGYDSMDTMN